MSNLGRWQWLAGDGVPAELNGWVYTQGCWSWGMVITWHIELHIGLHWWVGTFWCWNKHTYAWDTALVVTFEEDPRMIEDWMVHHVTYAAAWEVRHLMLGDHGH